ncbi:MAG: hypothetical protein WCW84_12675 [Sulfurimonas sp.]
MEIDKMSYIDRLIKNCELAKKATPIQEFVFKNLDELDSIKQAIYIIEEINGDNGDTFSKFSNYKERKERKCAKLNSPSNIMYVGSSTNYRVKTRIKQHLGNSDSYKETYALHLGHWFVGEYKITIKQYDVIDNDVLQIIEDDLSDQLKPAFGKQGGNNR